MTQISSVVNSFSSQEKRLAQEIASLEKDTGFKLRVLAQNYPDTPGIIIRSSQNFLFIEPGTVKIHSFPTKRRKKLRQLDCMFNPDSETAYVCILQVWQLKIFGRWMTELLSSWLIPHLVKHQTLLFNFHDCSSLLANIFLFF